MYPRIQYEMTEEDLKALLEACKPTRVMKIGNYIPPSPQENANRAWGQLGEKMGFDSMTVQPISGKGSRFFTAVPNETHEQKVEREANEWEEKKQAEIVLLRKQIEQLQDRLDKLLELPEKVTK